MLTTASTAIAYLNDKVEHRPGALDSSVRSTDGAGKVTYHKTRFHATGAPPEPDPSAPPDAKRVEPDDGDEAPGTRTKAVYGVMPLAKLGATHDSRSKGPRFDSEPASPFTLMEKRCVQPEMAEEPYEEVPSPLPSPRYDD